MVIRYIFPFVLIFILFGLLLKPIINRLNKRNFDLFEALIWSIMFYGWCYFLRPIYMVLSGCDHLYLKLDKNELAELLIIALGYAIIGIIFFYLGYRLQIVKNIAKLIPFPDPKWDKKASYYVILIYMVVGVICSIIYLKANGGIEFYITHINWFRGESLNIRLAFLQWGFILLPIAEYIWFLNIIKLNSSFFSKLLFGLYALSCSIILLMLGGRSTVIISWLMLALLYHYGKRPLRIRFMLVIFAFALIFLLVTGQIRSYMLSTTDHYNNTLMINSFRSSLINISILEDFLNSPNSDAMDVFIGILRGVPNKLPFQYGKQFIELFEALIPAGLIPMSGMREVLRVYLLGEQIRDAFWPWYGGGTPPSILGFLYINFHVIGIIIGMLIFGAFSRCVYSYFLYNRKNKGVILLYGLSVFKFITGMIRGGDFVHVAQGYLIHFLFMIIALILITHGRLLRRT